MKQRCVAHPSKPVSTGQTGSTQLRAACSNKNPKREDSFQQTEVNLPHNYLKTLNLSKGPKATETEEQ